MSSLWACAAPVPGRELAPPGADALWFGGDVHFGAAEGNGLGDIGPSLAGAVGIVNLEGPVTTGAGFATTSGSTVTLGNPADSGARLVAMGVGAVSIVNNHALDDGEPGVTRTLDGLRASGVATAGAEPARVPGVEDVTLFAYDLEAPDVDARLAAALDASTGTRVVSLHVTGVPSYLPRPELVAAVDTALAHGADIVVAHGTHVLGPVERRGSAVVAWGLGNLLFDCPCTTHDEAVLLRVSLAPGHAAEVIPIRAGLVGKAAALNPDPSGVFDLLAGLGNSPLLRRGFTATY